MPGGLSGNLSDVLETADPLLVHTDDVVKAWAEEADRNLVKAADSARQDKRQRAKREQSFE